MACNAFRVCLCVGIVGLVAGIVGWVAVPIVVRSKIAEVLGLRPNSESWDRWKDLPVPIQYRIYIFQVNNPEEISKGAMPNVTEVGPYVYKERRTKSILSVDERESKVIYDHKYSFEFDQEASGNLSEDDELTVVNVPGMLLALVVDNLIKFNSVSKLLDLTIPKIWPSSNPLFVKVKVRDFLFDGTPIMCKTTDMFVNILCQVIRDIHPRTVKLDDSEKNLHSFAFFRYKNETSDGIYEVDLGLNDATKLGQIRRWNNLTLLSDWRGESCNRILGTDTTIFRPFLEQDRVDSLYIYHTDICRSIKLTFKGDTEFKGVRGRRYVVGEDVLASVLENKDNYCFCPQSVRKITRYGGCLKSGLLELSSCQGGPIVISLPHFFLADPLFQGKIVGLNPDPEKHTMFLDLEPNTGYPLRGAGRVQINVFLKSIPYAKLFKNLPDVLIPAVWLEESVELTDDLIGMINAQLLNVLKVVDGVRWGIVGVGFLMVLGSLAFYFIKIRPKK